ncbi:MULTISPECIES: ABC transporter ATP-binding protein [Serratia]|jgi:iron complex transport system ATP-binding protein|uniref:Iron complex transport system ATP-binding protein n=1 Tax=Serratia marcescens TaxID=615 RepID=A0AA46K2T2_SERMA|nr:MULTISPECIES: ABC transporter ATP-binding protein [Serratia]MBH3198967.1 ABC transporter ATP-binding protein [Serratia marcescens]MBI6125776.1 ABC transporter ATP-binding protein [Serratia marcescens]MBL5821970.1 ABC transporter ATP-binding protein [Serratia marcescens]TQI83541.1 iron complex transport system ATP-binding protein [Serratia marcescens]BEM44071.1 ABC transporter ATP-binding protein [Serratia marcescens]
MITVNQLTLGFKGREPLLDNVSFHLARGEILSVLGPNGAGKTTLLRHIAGLCRPLSGGCKIGLVDNRPARLAYVPQAKTPHFAYGVLDFVTFGCARQAGWFARPRRQDVARAQAVLHALEIAPLAQKNINQISGGELQMCYFAKALAADPDVMILDEPESNLDFYNQAKMIEMLWRLAKERQMTIVLNTHFLHYADRISDKCLLMNQRQCMFGDKNALLQEDILERYFQVPVRKCRYEYAGVSEETFIVALRHHA